MIGDITEINPDALTISEEGGVRYLHFGTEWIQGAMRIRKPHDLVLSYTQQMMAWLLFERLQAKDEIAILGLGAGSLLRFCLKHFANPIHTVELNPAVTTMCKMYFNLPMPERSHIHHIDALQWVQQAKNIDQYKILLVDLYDAYAQGPTCSSLEFYQDCYQVLNHNGILSVNLFGNHHSYNANLDHLHAAFNGQVLILPEVEEGNVVALAFKGDYLAQTTTAMLLDSAHLVQERYKLPARRWAKALLAEQP